VPSAADGSGIGALRSAYSFEELIEANRNNPSSAIPTGGISGWGAAPIDPRRMVVDNTGTVWMLPAPSPADAQIGTSADAAGSSAVASSLPAPAALAAAVAAVDPREVAIEVLHEVPLPDIRLRMNPDTGLVALPAWFWVEGYDGAAITRGRRVDVPPLVGADVPLRLVPANDPRRRGSSFTVEVRIWPTRYDWSFGDGTALTSRTLGQRYPQESEVRHAYESSSLRTSGGFPIRLTVGFAAEFRVDGGPAQALPPTERTYDARYRVQEIQSVLVGR
jgi:hypothetical protein